MNSYIRRGAFAAALLLTGITACQDARLRALETGMAKDSALAVLAEGKPMKADTIPNVYRHTRYFMDSKEIDIFMFDPKNRKMWEEPNVTNEELTPVVMIDGKVDGWGWDHMEDVTSKYRIVLR
jgi:hypothetical protein